MGIQQRLAKFPVPQTVWDEYHQSEKINDTGVRLDMDLVAQAIEMDTQSRQKLTASMKHKTALENPNSVQQMEQWLADNGMHVIIVTAQNPKAIRHTVYSANNIFIFIKRSALGGTALNLFPELLRKLSTGSYIVIGIYCPLFLASKIKCYVADFDVMIPNFTFS